MALLVLVVGPDGPERADRAAAVRAQGHVVVEAAEPSGVPLDLAPELLLVTPDVGTEAWLARLGPVATTTRIPAAEAHGRLLSLTAGQVDLRGQRFFPHEGEPVVLRDKELALLAYLVAHSGEVVSRGELLEHVWGYAPTMRTRTVDNTLRRLRSRVEAHPSTPDHLRTVRGGGYQFVALAGAPTPTTIVAASATPAPEPDAAPTGGPTGTLLVGSGRGRAALALYQWAASTWNEIGPSVIEPLVRLDGTGRAAPELLDALAVDDDGLGATLRLRPGLWFHPHPELPTAEATADDLVASLRLAVDSRTMGLPLVQDGLHATGPRTVRLSFTRPVGPLAHRLLSVLLVPAGLAAVEDLDDMAWPVGTGPFRFEAPVAFDHLEVVAWERHWRSRPGAPVPQVARVVVRRAPIGDPQAVVGEVAAGRLHVAPVGPSCDAEQVRVWAEAAGLSLARRPAGRKIYLKAVVWFRAGPGRDERRALHRSLDRRPLARADVADLQPGSDLLPPAAMGHDVGFELPPAGALPPRDRPLRLGVYPSDFPLFDALQEELRAMGVPATRVQLGQDSLAEQLQRPTIDGAVLHLARDMWGADPYPLLEPLVRSAADIGPLDAQALELLDALESTALRGERVRLIRRLVDHLHEEAPVMPLGFVRSAADHYVVHPRVRGYVDATGQVVPSELPSLAEVSVDA